MTQTILITGASEGIGLEIARQAVAEGAKTVLVARDGRKLETAAASLHGTHRPELAAIDLTDTSAVEKWLDTLDQREIIPDVLINNAGRVH